MFKRSKSPSPSHPQIPDHTLICLIGKGSYGEVWLARNVVGTLRAVKVIYRSAFDHDRPYEREFAGIKRFEPISRSHEGLVDILHLGRNDEAGYFYYVMEVADDDRGAGEAELPEYAPRTLRSELARRGRLPVADCVDLGLRMTEALDYLHGQGLVHRDIKPSNIIFVGGVPKLADIGLVAALDETRSYVGTEGFIPPEGPGNPQADLYSLGKVLYEISTGKDRQDYPELPAEFMEGADRREFAELNEIIIRACLDDPGQRYQSAREMQAELAVLHRGKSIRQIRARETRGRRLKIAGGILLAIGILWAGVRVVSPQFAAGVLALYCAVAFYLFVRAFRVASRAAKQGTRPEVHRGFWLAAGAMLLLAFLVGVGWMASLRGGSALPFASRDSILVTDFSNETGDPVFDKSLWVAFTVGLQQSRYANVLPRARIDQVFTRMSKSLETRIDEAIGREICLRENVRGLVVCDIATVGGKYVISARLVDPQTSETVRVYQERASGRDDVIAALGEVAAQIRKDLGESLSSIRRSNLPLPQVTTHSLDALRAFADGRYLWRKGSYKEAVKLYETALANDPSFAMAHAELGAAYFSFIYNEPTKGNEHYQSALAAADRITERERLYIQAAYRRDMGHVDEALQYYTVYLAAYPDDAETRYNLATFLMLSQRVEEAIEQFKEVIRISPNNTRAYLNLATSNVKLDRCDEALRHYAKAFELEPNRVLVTNLNNEYGFTLARTGNLVKARETFNLIAAKPDTRAAALRSLALLDMYQGRYRSARQRLEESTLLYAARGETLGEARNHVFLAILLEAYGNRSGQLNEVDAAAKHMRSIKEPQMWLAARIGTAYARNGAIIKAEEILRDSQPRVDLKNPQHRSFLHLIEGEIALARGNKTGAIELLLLADREFTSAETIANLARACDVAGQTAQAIQNYQRLIANGRDPLGWEPQQAFLVAHMRLAEIYWNQGEKDKAAQTLRPLAILWKEADPDLPPAVALWKLVGKPAAARPTMALR